MNKCCLTCDHMVIGAGAGAPKCTNSDLIDATTDDVFGTYIIPIMCQELTGEGRTCANNAHYKKQSWWTMLTRSLAQ